MRMPCVNSRADARHNTIDAMATRPGRAHYALFAVRLDNDAPIYARLPVSQYYHAQIHLAITPREPVRVGA